jgi:mono/diheme cytochrome c family protein
MKSFKKTAIGATLVGLLTLLSGCNVPLAGEDEQSVDAEAVVRSGIEIARAECASCHAIGRSGPSPHPEALEFRRFSRFYPVEDLDEALAEGIYIGHPDMPVFRFEPDEVEALVDYIQSVQEPLEL